MGVIVAFLPDYSLLLSYLNIGCRNIFELKNEESKQEKPLK